MAVEQGFSQKNSIRLRPGLIGGWIISAGSIVVLLFLLLQFIVQATHASPSLFSLVQDIPLPSVLPPKYLPNIKHVPSHLDPLAPGVSVRFDHFDFQALDAKTGLLFIAHTGPAPDKVPGILANNKINPDDVAPVDGSVLVFDIRHNRLVKVLPIPQVAGVVAAPDLGRIFVADSNDNKIVAIDEHTFKTTEFQLDDLASPDAIEYDPIDHKLFTSNVGLPKGNAANIDPREQNLGVINLQNGSISKINLGHLPKLPHEQADLVQFGYDVGHTKFDAGLHRIYVTTQQLTDQGATPPVDPPGGTGELVSVNPVTQRVEQRVQLPVSCGIPHGMSIDSATHIAYIACTEVNAEQHLAPNLVRVNLVSMQVMAGPVLLLPFKPDIVVLDKAAHTVFVGCNGAVAVFDIGSGNVIRARGSQFLGKGTHTLAVNPATQIVYLPLADAGGRPTLRIAKYYLS